MLTFSPDLSGLESLNSHRSTLEGFGKKVDEKTKTLRPAELLFAAKKSDWDRVGELSQELKANSERVVVLTEGMCECLLRAVESTCGSPFFEAQYAVEIVSSSLHPESLKRLAGSLVGKKVSLLVLFSGSASERLVWCFKLLVSALSQGRHPDEVKRRVIVSSGGAASEWELWAQASSYRTVSFPHRCAGRYLFFSEPTALLLSLLGLSAWSYVEGGRSFFRQFDKLAETDDPILAYSALREVQLAEHYRETLVLPDETFLSFGRWWQILTEDSRALFCEEANDGLVWTGSVMKETAQSGRRHWVTEITVDSESELDHERGLDQDQPPSCCPDVASWSDLESLYRDHISQHRSGSGYAQPSVQIGMRRRDPFCLGALFCFFECIVSASHRLAETNDTFDLCTPYSLSTSKAGA